MVRLSLGEPQDAWLSIRCIMGVMQPPAHRLRLAARLSPFLRAVCDLGIVCVCVLPHLHL
jgi:hypothetical protein